MKLLHSFFVAGFLVVVAMLSACDTTGVIRHDFAIAVDEVVAPDTIATTDLLPVHLTGVIGNDSCHSLLRIDQIWREPNRLVQIVAMGRLEIRDQPCQQVVVFLDETVEIGPAETTAFPVGELTIQVLRPAPSEPIERTVVVIPDEG